MLQLPILVCILSSIFCLPLLYVLPRKIHPGVLLGGLNGMQAVFWLHLLPQVATHPISYTVADLLALSYGFTLSIGYYLDEISVLMMLLVSVISGIVALYSIAYLPSNASCKRYFGLYSLSVAAMYIILVADQLWGVFLGWECLCITSCLLVGFWYYDPVAAQAGRYTWLMHQVGSMAFLVGMVLIALLYDNPSIPDILSACSNRHDVPYSYFIGWCFVIAGCTKAAQFPFFTWLPHAMAAPIPISALLHTATVLSAGVYLLARTYLLFPPALNTLLIVIGYLTAFIGATTAFFRQGEGVKSILAYATSSQFGYIVAAIGLGEISAAIVYLLMHAFAKTCLFLLTGVASKLLQQSKGYDNKETAITLRCMGKVLKKCPLSSILYVISMWGMGVIPGTVSFVAKECILAQSLVWANGCVGNFSRFLMLFLIFGSPLVTLLYILNAFERIFCNTEGGYKITGTHLFKYYKTHWLMYSTMFMCSTCIFLIPTVLSYTTITTHVSVPKAAVDVPFIMSFIVGAFLFYSLCHMIVRRLLPHAYDYKWMQYAMRFFLFPRMFGDRRQPTGFSPPIRFSYIKRFFYKTEAHRIDAEIWDYTVHANRWGVFRMLVQGWYVDPCVLFFAKQIAAFSQMVSFIETQVFQSFLHQLARATIMVSRGVHKLDQRCLDVCIGSIAKGREWARGLYLRLHVERIQRYILWSCIGLCVLIMAWMLSFV